MQLDFPAALPCIVYHRERLGQPDETRLALAHLGIGLGQQGQTIRPKYLCPRGSPGRQALLYLGYAFLPLPLSCTRLSIPLGQRPTSHGRPSRYPECKPLLGREGYERLCPLLSQVPLPAELVEPGRKEQGRCQTEGMRHLLG